jgi:hypothetical protein
MADYLTHAHPEGSQENFELDHFLENHGLSQLVFLREQPFRVIGCGQWGGLVVLRGWSWFIESRSDSSFPPIAKSGIQLLFWATEVGGVQSDVANRLFCDRSSV